MKNINFFKSFIVFAILAFLAMYAYSSYLEQQSRIAIENKLYNIEQSLITTNKILKDCSSNVYSITRQLDTPLDVNVYGGY